MRLTIPVLRHGSGFAELRKHWECPGGMLPETIEYDHVKIEPSKDAVVTDVQFQGIDYHREEPWTIVWVKVEVPDDSVKPLEFKAKRKPVDNSTDGLSGREKVLAQMKSAPDMAALVELHKARLADAEIDSRSK